MNNPDIKIAHINTAEKLKNPIDKALVYEVVQRNVNQTLKGKGVNPARNIIPSQAKKPPRVDILS